MADSLQIGINSTNEICKAANQLPLDVYGQSKYPLQIECETSMGPVKICLGIVLIVTNLGVSCLIGEPAKRKNNIVCLPRQKVVVFASGQEAKYAHYADRSNYTLLRATTTESILPNECVKFQLPDFLKQEPVVNVIP